MERLKRIKEIAKFAYDHTVFYHELYNRIGINVDSICSIEELPIVTPEDLRSNAMDFRANISVYKAVMTSGTISKPKIVFRTKEDFLHSVQNEITLLEWAGVSKDDIVCVVQPFGINGYGELTAAACEQLGVFVVPLGDVSDDMLISSIQTFHVSVLDITPSRLIRLLKHPKFYIKNTNLRLAIVAGEQISGKFKQYIYEEFGIRIINQFGSTECDGLAGEKGVTTGMFSLTDDFIFEEVEGQLVITSLYHKGTPLVRYRLGDYVEITSSQIVVKGRQESFQLFDGIKIDEISISEIVEKYGGIQWQCLIYENKHELILQVQIESNNNSKSILDQVKKELENSLDFWNAREYLKVQCCHVDNLISNGLRKIQKFIDLRKADDAIRISLLENKNIMEFYFSLPNPLTDKKAQQIINSIKQLDFEVLWEVIICCVHLWTAKARKILIGVLKNCLENWQNELLHNGLELSQSSNWETREEAAKLVGMIIMADFYNLSGWIDEQLQCSNENVRRTFLVGIKYCAQYEKDNVKHKALLDMLDKLLYDKSRYVLKSFDSFVIGDGFLNVCPDLVDEKLGKWILLNDAMVDCKIIRVFKSSGGKRNKTIAYKYLEQFVNNGNPDVKRALSATMKYLNK